MSKRINYLREVSLIVVAVLLLLIVIFTNPVFTGKTTYSDNIVTEKVNLFYNESSVYHIDSVKGNVSSLMVTGSVSGNGTVRIYLNGLLVLDSELIKEKKGLSGVTGLVVDENLLSNNSSEIEVGTIDLINSSRLNKQVFSRFYRQIQKPVP